MSEPHILADASKDKMARYAEVTQMISAVLAGEDDVIARMATVASLLREAFPETFFWVGFYVVARDKPETLVVGPYQGTLGCLRIPFGKGVCGSVAASGQTAIVDDVRTLANHISCDSRSRSEIVVPVRGRDGALMAVLDIDSTAVASFDEVDQTALEHLVALIFSG